MRTASTIIFFLTSFSFLLSCGDMQAGESTLAATRSGVVGAAPEAPNDGSVIYKCGYHTSGFVCSEQYYNTGFGAGCWTGKKKLCVKDSLPVDSIWLGTSPSCGGQNAECPAGYREEAVAKNDGEARDLGCNYLSARQATQPDQCWQIALCFGSPCRPRS